MSDQEKIPTPPAESAPAAEAEVKIERHGFIWGGRWYHYDTMHFEYRPEMIAIAKAGHVSACP